MNNKTEVRDFDGYKYYIPNELIKEFNEDSDRLSGISYYDDPSEFDVFFLKYEKYLVLGYNRE